MSKYVRRGLNWYANIWPKRIYKPPYYHVVQIGDPVLRSKSDNVPLTDIPLQETKDLIRLLKEVMESYKLVGLAAPQIGINKRIFVMEMNQRHLSFYDKKTIEAREMSNIPLMTFINPTMKVTDFKKLSFVEGCASIKGYCAEVPRHKAVQIEGYNENADEVSITFEGWPARIAQHELDHLDGVCFIDKMDKGSFANQFWKEINLNEGKIRLPFSPE